VSELLLGIDVGTASSKAALVRPDGEVLARASRAHSLSLPRAGWAEQDAEAVWWPEVASLCRELLAGSPASGVAAVGISGMGPCLVPCDARDRPLRPAILYGIDTRAEPEAAELSELLGEEAILARGGSALSSQALGPKLLWLARHEPDVWAATRRWHTATSFLLARLTEEWTLDRHSASQCDPLYDLLAESWAEDWAATVPGLALPDLAWPGEVAGTVAAAAAAETGIPTGTPVIAGTIDAWAEAVSVGVRRPGELMLMYGSTMFFVLVSERPARDRAIWTTAGVDPHSLTHAAGMATSGSLTGWLRELFGEPPYEQLLAEAAATPAGADGLLLLPYFAGERTPLMDPRARGTVSGLTLRHTRGHLYRAALEGIACGARHNLAALAPGGEVRAVAVGGGTAGALWPQIVSDVTAVPQLLPAETLGAAYGGALLAAEAVGLLAPGSSWVREAALVEPNAELAPLYDSLFGIYRELHEATVALQHELADGARP
jgi:xylulokinase